MEFFSKVFTWLANLSSKLPQIDLKAYFIVVLAVIAGTGLIVGLTFFGSKAFKLKAACKKIIKYLSNVDSIDDDNVGDFTAECFSQKAPAPLRDSWVEYLGVRFGFPSDLVSEKNVYEREVKKVKDVRANLFIGIALILVAIFAFWGFGTLSATEMSVIHCAGLLLSAAIYLVLVFANRKQIKTTRDTFYDMQDELDAKVNFQVEKNFSTDSSPLSDLAAIVDEIIARNTAKEIEIEEKDQEPTPIEDLIEELENKRIAGEAEEAVKAVEEREPEPVYAMAQPVQAPEAEEPAVEQAEQIEEPEEDVQEEQAEEQAEQEPEKKEPVALKESLAAAKKAGNALVGKKFFGDYLKEKYGEGVEVNERENKTSTGLPLADTYFALDGANRKCFAYAYDIDGASLLLVNADSVLEDNLKQNHENVNLSAFPKSKDTWYSLPLDNSYSEEELKGILDYCYAHALGKDLEPAEEKPVEEPTAEEAPAVQEQPVEETVEDVQEEQPVEQPTEETQEEEPQQAEEEPVQEQEEQEEPQEEQEEPAPEEEAQEEPQEEESQDEPQEVEESAEEVNDEPAEEQPTEEQPSEEETTEEPAAEEPAEEQLEESQEETPVEEQEEGEGIEEESETSEDETEEDAEEESEDEESVEDAEDEESAEDAEDDETVVYVVDDEEEEEEYVQPSKLSKLSNLTDYMLAQNMSKKVKMQVATLLIGVYNKFKDSPEDKKIIVDCLKKVIFSLQEEQSKPKYVEDESADENSSSDDATTEDVEDNQE